MSPLLLAVSLAVGAPALKDKPPASDLYGEWEIVSTEQDGKFSPASNPPARWRFNRNGTYETFRGEKRVGYPREFRFDPKADPPTLDTHFSNSPRAGGASGTLLCVYRLNGDELTVCRADPGLPRPSEFAAPAGSGLLVVRFRRVKPEE
jgi:uncharacterized protein (TIGR03067 family)